MRSTNAKTGSDPICRLVACCVLAACSSGSPPATPTNTAPAQPSALKATDAFGALVVVRDRRVFAPTFRPAPGSRHRVIGASGALQSFTAGAPTKISHGCDGNQLEVVPLDGPALPDVIAWLVAGDWTPTPLPRESSSPGATTFGTLRVQLTLAADRTRGTMDLYLAKSRVHSEPFERVLMDGADPAMATIDLATGGPGVPRPVAAWSIEGSSHLLVVEVPGWEGTAYDAYLVDPARAAKIEAMSLYLYQCAF